MAERRLPLAATLDEALAGLRPPTLDEETRRGARAIVEDVRARGEAALRKHAERLGDLAPGAPLVIGRDALDAARDALDPEERAVLERTAGRIRRFAEAQRDALAPLDLELEGGRGGHRIRPLQAAGCYAPGGRFPLPSSVLMTAVTARAAGVETVWAASPRPARVTLAAASIAEVDGLLAVGGAQAVAALAFGTVSPRVDLVAGPGNRWVTAAKAELFGEVGIDLLAGPSELTVVADTEADPARVAADLLAVAEHDDDAVPVLIALDPALPEAVEAELVRQLEDLPTRATAERALANGFALVAASEEEAAAAVDAVAPEHLELELARPREFAERVRHCGAIFLGASSPEVLGDYGAGPNHVLPTGRSARYTAGLNVFSFLRVQTWLELDGSTAARAVADDAARLARLEGLEAHGRSADRRR